VITRLGIARLVVDERHLEQIRDAVLDGKIVRSEAAIVANDVVQRFPCGL
jgi:hypothetical protein